MRTRCLVLKAISRAPSITLQASTRHGPYLGRLPEKFSPFKEGLQDRGRKFSISKPSQGRSSLQREQQHATSAVGTEAFGGEDVDVPVPKGHSREDAMHRSDGGAVRRPWGTVTP